MDAAKGIVVERRGYLPDLGRARDDESGRFPISGQWRGFIPPYYSQMWWRVAMAIADIGLIPACSW
jgi:hypothetical protein